MELHGGDRQPLVLERHHHAVRGLGGDAERRGQGIAARVERVVAAGAERPRHSFEQASAEHVDLRRLAVRRTVEHAQRPAKKLDDPLKAEAHAEQRQLALERDPHREPDVEVARPAGARREHHRLCAERVERPAQLVLREPRADRRHLGAGASEVVREGVDERVLVVHEEYAPPGAHRLRRCVLRRGDAGGPPDRVEERGRLELDLALLGLGDRIDEERRARADLGDAVLHADRPQREAGVHVAVEADEADRAAIPRA